jgi:hypothetical protein
LSVKGPELSSINREWIKSTSMDFVVRICQTDVLGCRLIKDLGELRDTMLLVCACP